MPSAGPSPPPVYETQFHSLPGDEENLWDALEILKEKRDRYLVKWDGVDPATKKPWNPSWVPKQDCTNELIHDWKLSKAKKARSRKKKSLTKDELAYVSKHSRISSKSSRPRSISWPGTAASRKLPSADSSSIPVTSSKTSPIVEITRLKKRPREGRRSYHVDLPEEDGAVAPTRKKRRLSPSSPEDDEEPWQESKEKAVHASNQMELQQRTAGQRRATESSQDIDADGSIVMNEDDENEVVAERKSQDGNQDPLQLDKQGYYIDDPASLDDDQAYPAPESNFSAPSSSLPSPRALLSSKKKRTESILSESQTSTTSSEPQPKIQPSNGRLAKASPSKYTTSGQKDAATRPLPHSKGKAPKAPRELRPVPSISPSIFKTFRPKAKTGPEDSVSASSQVSDIETFTSPNKKRRVSYTQLQQEDRSGFLSDGTQNIGYGAQTHLDRDLIPEEQHRRRTFNDVLSKQRASTRPKGTNEGVNNNVPQRVSRQASITTDDASLHAFNKRLAQSSKLLQDDDVETSQATDTDRPSRQDDSHIPGRSDSDHITSNVDGDDLGGGHDLIDNELGPDDALDTFHRHSGQVNATHSTLVKADSILTSPWRQLATIGSPIKQLDKAIGLLNLKSLEIEELKASSERLQRKLGALEAKLSIAERRYAEVNAMLDIEKVQRAAVANSVPMDEERVNELLQEVARLKAANKELDSDKDLFRGLYSQASDAHQTVLNENRALVRDNQSLREQATTGVKQAGVFWKTQVHTLETELARVRGTIKVFTDQARRTDDNVRRRAALLPMAQKDTLDALQEAERLEDDIRSLGRENTTLRLQVKDLEDEAMARRKEKMDAMRREQERESMDDASVWVCHWVDVERHTKCAALLESREKLREHFYESGHI